MKMNNIILDIMEIEGKAVGKVYKDENFSSLVIEFTDGSLVHLNGSRDYATAQSRLHVMKDIRLGTQCMLGMIDNEEFDIQWEADQKAHRLGNYLKLKEEFGGAEIDERT